MRKQKQPKPETPQKFSWKTHLVTDSYVEAAAAKDKLKGPVKIHLQRGRYHVKIGEPVKAAKAQPLPPTEE